MSLPQRVGKINPRILIPFLIIDSLLMIGVAWWLLRKPGDQRNSTKDPSVLRSELEKGEKALGLLENERFTESLPLWEELVTRSPNDPSLALNLALCRLGRVGKQLEEIEGSNQLSEQQREEMRAQVPDLLGAADRSIQRALELSPQSPAANRLAIAVKLEQAKLLEYPADVEMKSRIADQILQALTVIPGDSVLTVKLYDLAMLLEGEVPALRERAANATFVAWQKSPRNLFLMQIAGQLLLSLKDQRVAELIDPSIELTKPFLDQILINAAGSDPIAKLAVAKTDIAAGRFDEATPTLIEWFNLLLGAAPFKPDQKLADPNLLSMVSLDTLSGWRTDLAKHSSSTNPSSPSQVLEFAERPLSPLSEPTNSVRCAIWYDLDLDLNSEIAYVSGNKLTVSKPSADNQEVWSSISTIDVDPSTTRLYAIDLFSVTVGEQPRISPADAKAQASVDAQGDADKATGIVDRRHDTFQDLILLNDQGVQIITTTADADTGLRKLTQPPQASGLENLPGVTQLAPLDWDADGDLDLAAVVMGKVKLFQNNGNRTFTSLDAWSELVPADITVTKIVACDYDRDIDVDLMLACEQQSLAILENLLHSQFRYRKMPDAWNQLSGAKDLAVAELDGNASWDWNIISSKGIFSLLTTTPAIGETTPLFIDSLSNDETFDSLGIADLNNDSWNDLIIWGSSGLRIVAGNAGGKWSPISSNKLLLDKKVNDVSIADIDRSGRLTILAATEQGLHRFLVNPTSPSNFMEARLKGIDDSNGGGRINHYGVGSVLEVRAGERYLAQVVTGPVTHFGLGDIPKADTLRVLFSNGVTQSIIEPPLNAVIEEKQAPKGSCPFLYGWDGEKFVMITDLLWNAPLGLQIARGKVLPDRRWEYLLLPAEKMKPKGDRYELRITEELWEAAYFDEVRLMAIDHPADVEVFTNEKVGPPDIAQPKIYRVSDKIYPQAANDSSGRNWIEAISQRDSIFARGFTRNFCQGLVDKHYLELDFGTIPAHQQLQLVLTGWLFPTDTSLNIGLDHNPELGPPVPPSLWLADESGNFSCIRPFMGFPGGKTKSIVIDLSGDVPAGRVKLRIETSAQLHWDEAFLVVDQPEVEIKEQVLSMQSARLHYRGFSTLMPREFDQPHWYDYNTLAPESNWPVMEGYFTNYGDVLELLSSDDDRLVVMGSGDEIMLTFAPPEAPLPEDWRRDFVLYSTGWDKDADLNTLEGQSSLPLPFKSMTAYPPPASQAEKAREVWELNRPNLRRKQNFRDFWKF